MAPRADPRPALPRRLPHGRQLAGTERVSLALEILAAWACARLSLRGAPIDSAVAALRAGGSAGSSAEATTERLEEARRLGRAVGRTLRFVPGDTRCLVRSLVLTRLLARRGIPAKLVIGARAQPEFLGHAWVEHEGQPVLAPGDESFGRLVEL